MNNINPLYRQPLHGVACLPWAAASYEPFEHQVQLEFASLTIAEPEQPLWTLKDQGERYLTDIQLYQQHNSYQLNIACEGQGVFQIQGHNIQVDWRHGTDSAHYFQTLLMGLWLELQSVVCLHANALALDDGRAIGLIAPSGMGKSTLTAALCQRGFSLMTDDMMALYPRNHGYQIYPSWPVMRIWPKTLQNLAKVNIHIVAPQKVHQRFDKRLLTLDSESPIKHRSQPASLAALYFLDRVEIDEQTNASGLNCEITDIPCAEGLMKLLQNSILGDAYRSLKLEKQRLTALSNILTRIPFRRIRYKSGAANLEHIVAAVLANLG